MIFFSCLIWHHNPHNQWEKFGKLIRALIVIYINIYFHYIKVTQNVLKVLTVLFSRRLVLKIRLSSITSCIKIILPRFEFSSTTETHSWEYSHRGLTARDLVQMKPVPPNGRPERIFVLIFSFMALTPQPSSSGCSFFSLLTPG